MPYSLVFAKQQTQGFLATDVLTGSVLVLAGLTTLAAVIVSHRQHQQAPSPYWLIVGVGLVYLGFDEWFSIHATIGRKFLPTPPGFNHPDDIVVAVYGLAGLAATIFFRAELFRRPQVGLCVLVALFCTGGAVVFDGLLAEKGSVPVIEETIEATGAGAFLLAGGLLLRSALSPTPASETVTRPVVASTSNIQGPPS